MKQRHLRHCLVLAVVLACWLEARVAHSLELKLYTRTDFNTFALDEDSLPVRLSDDYDNRIQALLEANADLGMTLFETLRLYTDTSLFYLGAERHPALKINELRAELTPHEHLSIWIGKRRVDHSVGYAFSPTNVLSPAKSPSEPMLEREGRYGAGLALPFDAMTFTFTWALHHELSAYGTPSAFDYARHSFLGAIYLNLWQSDINLLYANIEQRHAGGLNFSRYLWSALELHFEILVQQGRTVPEPSSIVEGETTLVEAPSFADHRAYFKGMGGLRFEFLETKGLATVEYYLNGAGLSADEIDQTYDYFDGVAALKESSGAAQSAAPTVIEELFGGGLPGRHHLMFFFQYRELLDYWTPSLSCIWSMEDSSFQLYPKVGYRLNDALLLETGLVIPVGKRSSEFGMLPRTLTHLIRIWVYI